MGQDSDQIKLGIECRRRLEQKETRAEGDWIVRGLGWKAEEDWSRKQERSGTESRRGLERKAGEDWSTKQERTGADSRRGG
ncbi:hypothetical protein XELAEV_18007908mg [Xenopus laevis]|uniref:Uncharacterized protein n=2 Tax=Xenopus laevis TaxID=8355 RepID=A0A974E2T2_XENLA|nr:hypothetical protein XELAEV_18003028mg [Xenopus laevis]OCU02146.1 hypothetical protein XELAEV_18007908mg [Xenopus laevis]